MLEFECIINKMIKKIQNQIFILKNQKNSESKNHNNLIKCECVSFDNLLSTSDNAAIMIFSLLIQNHNSLNQT